MKQRIKWIAALFTVASAGLALGCGCSSESPRLQPVRKIVVQQPACTMESSSTLGWGTHFRTVGYVTSAPIVSNLYVEPVGERLTIYHGYSERSYSSSCLMPVGERFTTVKVIRHEPILQPVGERFITVKSIRTEPILQPVGEWFTTEKIIRSESSLQPVGEQFLRVKHHHKKLIKPVGEKFIIEKRFHKTTLKPVGEKKSYHKTMLKPVGQKINWHKSNLQKSKTSQ